MSEQGKRINSIQEMYEKKFVFEEAMVNSWGNLLWKCDICEHVPVQRQTEPYAVYISENFFDYRFGKRIYICQTCHEQFQKEHIENDLAYCMRMH